MNFVFWAIYDLYVFFLLVLSKPLLNNTFFFPEYYLLLTWMNHAEDLDG